jgi:SAM-dependent methyltransferase
VARIVSAELTRLGGASRGLDVGSGEGWFAARFVSSGVLRAVVGLDVKRRERIDVEPVLYDGETIPFADQSFDVVYAIDAIHHATNPPRVLHEMARVSSRWIVLKDHTSRSFVDRQVLRALDWAGNVAFGIPSPARYQSGWTWLDEFERLGFVRRYVQHPAECHVGALGKLTNRLQFVATLERIR